MVDIKNLVGQAKAMDDQSVAKSGGDFEYVPAKEGKTMARFVEYIELGKHPQTHEGKPKPDADEVRVVFDLLSPHNIREVETEGGPRKVCDRIGITMTKKQSDKAKFFKLFKLMQMGRDGITHMAEMLGEAYFVDIKHSKSADGKLTFANFYKDQQWFLTAPRIEDPVTGLTTDYASKVPEAVNGIKLFLFDIPTKETWDSIFIDGSDDVKNDDGSTTVRSRNRWQEKVLSAKNFGGSALEQMLGGLDNLPTDSQQGALPSGTESETSVAVGDAEAGTTTPSDPSDDLAALGLG